MFRYMDFKTLGKVLLQRLAKKYIAALGKSL
jgi:hypothetical protein